jgi:hypothetical protein
MGNGIYDVTRLRQQLARRHPPPDHHHKNNTGKRRVRIKIDGRHPLVRDRETLNLVGLTYDATSKISS